MAIGGLDIGTSSCKFAAYDMEGFVICECKSGYREYGTGGIREINPEEVKDAVLQVLKEAAIKCPEPLEGFAVTALGESFVAADEKGRILNRSMVTGDKRGIAEKEKLTEQFKKEEILDITGVSPSEMYGLPKLMWIRRNTDVFERTEYIFMFEDYIAYLLTGERKISYSSAARSMAFDIRKKEWSKALLAMAGITDSMLSDPVPSGTVIGTIKKEICMETGLKENTVLVSGGHDQMCAAIGNGIIKPGICGDGMGTCEVMGAFLPQIYTHPRMLESEFPCVPYMGEDTYLTYAVLTNCGILMNWYVKTFMQEEYLSERIKSMNKLELLDKETKKEPTGLLVIPNFGSSGNPHVDYEAKGTIWGLTVHTKQAEIFRSVKEGMAYHMKLCLEKLGQMGVTPKMIRVSGGGGKSDVTVQLRADIFGIPVSRMKHGEAGTAGCMILTGTALGLFRDVEEGVEKVVKEAEIFYPDQENYEQYKELYKKYKSLYELIYKLH